MRPFTEEEHELAERERWHRVVKPLVEAAESAREMLEAHLLLKPGEAPPADLLDTEPTKSLMLLRAAIPAARQAMERR